MTLAFSKYQGLGNDFILIDNRHQVEPLLSPEEAARWCDRHFGIGADGVIFALPGSNGADYTMRIYNSDGSEPEMCGNGIRCMARFVADLEGVREKTYRIWTGAGMIVPQLRADGQVAVDMGEPRLTPAEIPTSLQPAATANEVVDVPLSVAGQDWAVTTVSMGNPHCITFVDSVAAVPLEQIGPQFETHPVFPAKTNTEFVEVVNRGYLKMRVWERGAGITLACGTGACATLVAAVLTGRSDRQAIVELPGGPLEIEWRADNRLIMTGPAERVFSGTWGAALPTMATPAPASGINCAVDCINGCVRPDACVGEGFVGQASQFIEDTSLDRMLEMAEAAVRRRQQERMQAAQTSGPQWVFPEDGIRPEDL